MFIELINNLINIKIITFEKLIEKKKCTKEKCLI